MVGGQLYNAYVAAKYGVTIAGVDPADVELAHRELLSPEVRPPHCFICPSYISSLTIKTLQ